MIIQFGWGGLSLGAAAVALVVVWRARSIVSWNRSIRREMNALADESQSASLARRSACEAILTRCLAIYHSPAPKIGDLDDLREYVRSIAACFNPGVSNPEMQVPLGHIIHSIEGKMGTYCVFRNSHA